MQFTYWDFITIIIYFFTINIYHLWQKSSKKVSKHPKHVFPCSLYSCAIECGYFVCSTCWTIYACSCVCKLSAVMWKCWYSNRRAISSTCTSLWTWYRSTPKTVEGSGRELLPCGTPSRAIWPRRASTSLFCTGPEVRKYIVPVVYLVFWRLYRCK